MKIIPKHGKKNILYSTLIFLFCIIGGIFFIKLDISFEWLLLILISTIPAFTFFILKESIFQNQKIQLNKFFELEKVIESWNSIYSFLNFKFPLQTFSNFAISPDFANSVIRTILELKPNQITELGCGSSTIIAAQCLAQYHKTGKILSIEADQKYLNSCAYEIKMHQLEIFVDQMFAPYNNIEYNETTSSWYQINFNQLKEIDLLIIDGPPESLTKNSRLPALYVLKKYLKIGSVILVDDASRDDMKGVIAQWKKDFPQYIFEELYSTRGCIKITVK